MELDSVVVSLSVMARIYCGLSIEDSVCVAEKTVSLIEDDWDVVDLFDCFDIVWAASMTSGDVKENAALPIHPLTEKEQVMQEHGELAKTDKSVKEWLEAYPDTDKIVRPKEYKDSRFIVVKRGKKKNRKRWINNKGIIK